MLSNEICSAIVLLSKSFVVVSHTWQDAMLPTSSFLTTPTVFDFVLTFLSCGCAERSEIGSSDPFSVDQIS